MDCDNKRRLKFTPVQTLAIGFAVVILVGTILLSLPISSAQGIRTPFVDCFFTSTSAVCVTGLIVKDTGTYWSVFGKTIIIILIQIGGLGFMAFTTLISLILGKRITLKERLVMRESMNFLSLQGLVKSSRYILIFTFSVEIIGGIILSTQFIPQFGFAKGIAYGIFHSISAFCNAGFDIIGNFKSLTPYYNNPVIIITIALLIIIGGLGFIVWAEIYNYNKNRRLTLHSKVVVVTTFCLVVGGSILMFLFEFKNPNTIKNMPFGSKVLSAFFAGVSPRTAGFNSISTSDMTTAGKFLTIILMFIGGSPGSTAGGTKTTTIAVALMTIICVVKGKEDTEIFQKRVNADIVYRIFAIIGISLGLIMVDTMILSITEVGASLEYLLYEVTSAFGTVGLTLGLTGKLTFIGKIIIGLTMYAGRVGVLTLAVALGKNKKSSNGIKYPEDKVLI